MEMVTPESAEALGVDTDSLSLMPLERLRGWPGDLLVGLGQNNFHYRQALTQATFGPQMSNLWYQEIGEGQWLRVGFDPRALDLEAEPYLRLTYRTQCRALTQLLVNLDADGTGVVERCLNRLGGAQARYDLLEVGRPVYVEWGKQPENWLALEAEDRDWTPVELGATPFGHVAVRLHVTIPESLRGMELLAELGTFDDYDITYFNGVEIGRVDPDNSLPERAFATPRVYPIPAEAVRWDEDNVFAIEAWNRNAETLGWKVWIRGPLYLTVPGLRLSLYVGDYKPSDDPYYVRWW